MRVTRGNVASIVVAVLCCAPAPAKAQGGTAPGHLRLLDAAVVETAAREFVNDPGRRIVAFRWVVAGPPPCDRSDGTMQYLFLVDADRAPTSGARVASTPGVDGAVRVSCDRTAGRFVSRLGPVTSVALPQGRWLVELAVALSRLPSNNFRWVAVARHGARIGRWPQSGESTWTTAELAVW